MGHVWMESRAYGESSDTSACSLVKAKRVSASAHALLANTSAIVKPGAGNNHSGADHLTITGAGEHGKVPQPRQRCIATAPYKSGYQHTHHPPHLTKSHAQCR